MLAYKQPFQSKSCSILKIYLYYSGNDESAFNDVQLDSTESLAAMDEDDLPLNMDRSLTDLFKEIDEGAEVLYGS